MITREHYIKNIREFYESDLVKIITGIRRCGKSVILNQVITEIKKRSNNVIYLNFEDKKRVALITTDTYRIAAAEQLRTYANIMDAPFRKHEVLRNLPLTVPGLKRQHSSV